MQTASDIGCADDGAIDNRIRNFYFPFDARLITQYQSAGSLPQFGNVSPNMSIDAHASREANIAHNMSSCADD